MANLEITIPHSLQQDEALQRIKKLLSETKKDHGDKIENIKEHWNGNIGNFSFAAKGFEISGTIKVHPSNIELKGKIPFAVSLFKGAIISAIEQKASELLA